VGGDDDATAAEATLVTRASAGDVAAFRALYEQHVGVVVGFLHRRVAPSDVEDLAAETFCRAFEQMPRYEWRGVPFRAWLLRIAFNLVVGRARRKSSTEVITADLPPVASAAAEDAAVRRVEAQELLAALARLPEPQRHVLELRFLEDLSVGETAAVIGSSEEAVRASTYRALRTLRAEMRAGAPDRPGGGD
jgi:RNA polymerase sigma-70 factor (ECF subfamily)